MRRSRQRAPFPREVDYAKSFGKDPERLSRSGRYDMHRLKDAMMRLIANDGPLGRSGGTTRSGANVPATANPMSAAIFCRFTG